MNKVSIPFKQAIQNYLENRAMNDTLFAVSFRKPNKNVDDCITYILNCVQKSGINGFTDDEIFGQAVHYYDEDNINVGNPINCKVIVNHTVELTAEEKETERQKAIQQVHSEVRLKMTKPLHKRPSIQPEVSNQLTLFSA